MTTGAHFGARRAAARGTHMKRESPMAIGFLARFVHVRTRFSKPPPSATRPRLRRAKSLENIAFNVNDGSARRAKNAGVGQRWHKRGHIRCHLGPAMFAARSRGLPMPRRRSEAPDDGMTISASPRSSGCLPSSSIVCVTNGFGAVAGAIDLKEQMFGGEKQAIGR